MIYSSTENIISNYSVILYIASIQIKKQFDCTSFSDNGVDSDKVIWGANLVFGIEDESLRTVIVVDSESNLCKAPSGRLTLSGLTQRLFAFVVCIGIVLQQAQHEAVDIAQNVKVDKPERNVSIESLISSQVNCRKTEDAVG